MSEGNPDHSEPPCVVFYRPEIVLTQNSIESDVKGSGTCCATLYRLDGQLVVSWEFTVNTDAFMPMAVFDRITVQPSPAFDDFMHRARESGPTSLGRASTHD